MPEGTRPRVGLSRDISKDLMKGQSIVWRLFLRHAKDPPIISWFHSRDLRLPPVITEEYLIGAPPLLIAVLRYHARVSLLKGTKAEGMGEAVEKMSQSLAKGFDISEPFTCPNDSETTTDTILPLKARDDKTIVELVYNPAWGLEWRSPEFPFGADRLADRRHLGKNITGFVSISPKTLAAKTEEILKLRTRKRLKEELLINPAQLAVEIPAFLKDFLSLPLTIGHCHTTYGHQEARGSYESALFLTKDEAVGLNISLNQRSGLKLAGIICDPACVRQTPPSLVRRSWEIGRLLYDFYPSYGY